MFMFRRKRNCLVKRLWKARIKSSNEVRSKEEDAYDEDDNSGQCCASCCVLSDEGLLRNAVLKRLQINQLEMLVEAVESGGACISTCVLIPKDVLDDPHLFCCQIWRWPDLRNATELRRTPACHSSTDPIYTCCNPYHWSRLCEPELPPPPYSRYNGEKFIADDGPRTGNNQHCDKENYGKERLPAPPPFYCQNFQEPIEFMGSFSTNGDSVLSENEQTWCKLAYWELTQRVGRMYPVQNNTVNVFWTDMQADGLSLEALAHHTRECFQPPPQSVCKNRTKIGLGITLSLEEDGVWVYNRSEWPIFVNSANIDETVYRRFLVYRVPAGHCFRIFVPGMASHSNNYWDNASVNSVRISFAKGWGPKYTRQEIISCPTWLEIHMSPYR